MLTKITTKDTVFLINVRNICYVLEGMDGNVVVSFTGGVRIEFDLTMAEFAKQISQ